MADHEPMNTNAHTRAFADQVDLILDDRRINRADLVKLCGIKKGTLYRLWSEPPQMGEPTKHKLAIGLGFKSAADVYNYKPPQPEPEKPKKMEMVDLMTKLIGDVALLRKELEDLRKEVHTHHHPIQGGARKNR
jgi:hypothetical protein